MPVAALTLETYFKPMAARQKPQVDVKLIEQWTLPAAATLGSAVRAKGILLELRARLPLAVRKMLDIRSAVLVLGMPEDSEAAFKAACAVIASALVGIETLPVIPREIEDILTISTTERHRWLKDGRLRSAGTRTVKLRGRARQITFHVFDPRHVEDILDRDLISLWREDDALRAAENRRRAAGQRALIRAQKAEPKSGPAAASVDDSTRHQLRGWAEFERDGPLR